MFAWFDDLGYPRFASRPYVKVATGRWFRSGNEPAENTYMAAFLLGEAPDGFTVVTTALNVETFAFTPDGTPAHEVVGYDRVDLATATTDILDGLARKEAEGESPGFRFGEQLALRAELFVLARACAGRDLHAQAERLLDAAGRIPDRNEQSAPGRAGLRAAVSRDLAHAEMWRGVVAFGDPKISRPALRDRFRRLIEHHGDSPHVDRARETVARLDQMIAEDTAHARSEHAGKEGAALDALPEDARIRELIHRLRDQNGHQWGQPGACDIFSDPRGTRSPAALLVAIGYPAMPQLIEAIDDQRFTRSVGYHRDFYFSHHVLRVGDATLAVISRIAGRHFYRRTYTNAAMVKDGQASETKRAVQAWWTGFQAKGEEATLVAAVRGGAAHAPAQARVLVARYPDAALAAIAHGARAASSSWVRQNLVEIAGGLFTDAGDARGAAVVRFLADESTGAPGLSVRVTAAEGLWARGDRRAVPAMMTEWRSLSRGPSAARGARLESPPDGFESLVRFLATSGRPEAVRVLASLMSRHAVARRLDVIENVGFETVPTRYPTADRAAFDAEVEALLIAALTDTEERVGMSGTRDGKSFSDPRICDIAGHALGKRFGARYTFDLEAPLEERDRARAIMQNNWRRTRGMALVPVPRPRQIRSLDPSVSAPLLDAVVGAETDAARRRAIAAVETHGLPVLAPVVARASRLSSDHVARGSLNPLAVRLANIVEIVELPASADSALKRRFQGLRGRSLTRAVLLGAMLDTARSLPSGVAGFALAARRSARGTGVVVTLETRPDTGQRGADNWNTHQRVTVGTRHLLGLSGTLSRDHGRTLDAFKELVKATDEALAAPPDSGWTIRVQLVLGD